MTDTTGTVSWPAGERRFSGITRVLAGFVVGALFALLPMYYFYMGREAGLKTGGPLDAPVGTQQRLPVEPALATGDAKPFASRLTYELSQLPQERPAAPPKAPPPAATPARLPVSASSVPVAPPAEPQVRERIANARPISATPPAPSDRTREIDKEAKKPDYREPPRAQAKAAPLPPAARVFEGRDIDVTKLPDTPTRPIVASAVGDMRAEIEAERSMAAGSIVRKEGAGAGADAAKKGGTVRPLVALATASTQTISGGSSEGTGGATPSVTHAADAMEARLDATREWLAGAAPTTHTIQLMGTANAEHLRAQMKVLGNVLDPAKLYIFRTKAQGKPSITVIYGAYPDRQSARQALEKLPASIAANKPVLRTVNGIRTELKQNKTDG
ncbi:MAG TPA: SPOR domain-containing protein [Burkholderiales bacterium]|nr:SPOR domain-containing protein [Burkholderiales bacterium]